MRGGWTARVDRAASSRLLGQIQSKSRSDGEKGVTFSHSSAAAPTSGTARGCHESVVDGFLVGVLLVSIGGGAIQV